MAMALRKLLPFIIASLLLSLLVVMFQSPKTLIQRPVNAQESDRSGYFYLPVGSANVSALTRADYEQLIGKFVSFSFNQVYQKTGMPLIIPQEWESPYFAAFAQKKDHFMQISLWGGMARAPGVTKAALAAILCHELGHILGGEPRQTIPGSDWASIEGQSDFYSASECLPRFLKENPEIVTAVDPQVEKLCGGNSDCARTLQAGVEMIQVLQKYSYKENTPVNIFTPERATSALVRNTYPSDQCRMDSYVQGALCQLGESCRAPVCWLPE
ncbi:MAG: hypothetical protein KUL82_07120 [Bdellovibrio sp.]|nr:hypothetical protein [Bdellovibrio sp.]